MNISFDIFSVITAIGVFQALFFGFLLVYLERGNRKANRILALFLLCAAAAISYQVVLPTGLYAFMPHYMKTFIPFQFAMGPLLYLYAGALTGARKPGGGLTYLHALPFLACAMYLAPYFLQGAEYKLQHIRRYLDSARGTDPEEWVIWIAFQLHFTGYLAATALVLRRHAKAVRDNLSSIARQKLSWLTYVTGAALTAGVLFAVISLVMTAGHSLVSFNRVITSLVSAMILVAGFKGLLQPEILIGERDGDLPEEREKYMSSGLTEERAADYHQKLLAVMEAEKLYLDPELTLTSLASRLRLPRTYLSQIINDRTGSSFHDFVNAYRVNEVKRIFADPSRESDTILSIALDAGFNSKAAFNAVFKRLTGMTPLQMKKTAAKKS